MVHTMLETSGVHISPRNENPSQDFRGFENSENSNQEYRISKFPINKERYIPSYFPLKGLAGVVKKNPRNGYS